MAMYVFFGLFLVASASAEPLAQCLEGQCSDASLEEAMTVSLLQRSTEQKKAAKSISQQSAAQTMKAKQVKRNPIDPEDVLGTCSGTDESGKTCPPQYSADRPCPPGCTTDTTTAAATTTVTTTTTAATTTTTAATTTAAAASAQTDGTYTWTTDLDTSYSCSKLGFSHSDGTVACAQETYQSGAGGTTTLTCSSGTIKCFLFASGGKVGGSCGGDAFYEDADGWGYMAEDTGHACLGKSSCDLAVGDGTVNDALVGDGTITAGNGKFNFKTLALCA